MNERRAHAEATTNPAADTPVVPHSVTFAVDDVTPATTALPTVPMYTAISDTLHGPIESCSRYTNRVVAGLHGHPLVVAVYQAFAEHRPLVLSPDVIWLTIAQGVGHHVKKFAEQLRHLFVEHEGRKRLTAKVEGFVKGSPENPWDEVVAGFGNQIRGAVTGDIVEILRADFTTTGPIERAAGDIVLMDVLEPYFQYRMVCICGIPTVTLEGTEADWADLERRVRWLHDRKDLGLTWWTRRLLPVAREFTGAAAGDANIDHWRNICKLRDEYGGPVINGWITHLLPYLPDPVTGQITRRNPVLRDSRDGITSHDLPNGLSTVPFIWRNLRDGHTQTFSMEFVAGFAGVTQQDDTLALRPCIGWVVREAHPFEAAIDRLERVDGLEPPLPHDERKVIAEARGGLSCQLNRLYQFCNGGMLPGGLRLLPMDQLMAGSVADYDEQSCWGLTSPLYTDFAELADGRHVGLNLCTGHVFLTRKSASEAPYPCEFPPVPVVAESLTEFFERWLDGSEQPYVDREDAPDYGCAVARGDEYDEEPPAHPRRTDAEIEETEQWFKRKWRKRRLI